MGLDVKNACRLCLNKDGGFHNLFSSYPGEVNLADELKCLVNFQILKEDHLSDLICSNCYKLNLFFKEFRIICAQVNEYVNELHSSEETCVEEVNVKLEIVDSDYEITVAADASKLDGGELYSSKDCMKTSNSTPAVSAFRLKCNERLNELRSKFISVQGLRDALVAKVDATRNPIVEYTSDDICGLASDGCEVQDEILKHLSGSRGLRKKKLLLRKDLYESNQNGALKSDLYQSSESNSQCAFTIPNNLLEISMEYPKQPSDICAKSIPNVRNDLDNTFPCSVAVDLSAPPVEVQIKQEDGEILMNHDDDFINGQIPPYSMFEGVQYGPSPASLSYYLSPQNRMGYVKRRRRLEINTSHEFKRETPEQRRRRLEKDRLRKQQKRKLESAEERRMRLEYDRIRQQRRRAREREEMNINQVAYSGILNYSCSDGI